MNPIGPEGDQRFLQSNLTTMQGIAANAAGNAGEPVPAADTAPQSYTDTLLAGPPTPNDTPVKPAAPRSRSPRKRK